MSMKLDIDNGALEKAEKLLSEVPGGMQTALMRSMNRALQEGRTAGTRAAAKAYTLRAKDVRPTFAMHKATKSRLDAELLSRGRNVPLSAYAHKPRTDTTGANRKQVRVGVKKGGLKPLGQAFISKGRVMQRLGATRLPVEQKYGPSVPGIIGSDEVSEAVVDTMGKAVEKRLEHETLRLLNK